ncbi:MAG: hypothetical protein ACIAS6_14195 [Phycisphaerales bacterium JB060]
MSTVPKEYPETIDWLAARITDWSADPALIGLSELELNALATELSEAQAALAAAVQARKDSKDATTLYHDRGRTLLVSTRASVGKIRAFAKASDDPEKVYSDASIPPPASPSPAPAPGQPFAFRTELLYNGDLKVSFECEHPTGVNGVIYKVERQNAPQTPFLFIENAKERAFTDSTIPHGSSEIAYRVTAQTSTRDGAIGGTTIRFGSGNQQPVVVSEVTSTSGQEAG